MVIPLAMLFTFSGMVGNKVSANLMSLGALDFGIIIDGAVVIVENCLRRLAHAQASLGRPLTHSERFHEVFHGSQEARRALLFGQLIIIVVYLPIFALTGVEGKMFHPMAFTVVAALLGAMILSISLYPGGGGAVYLGRVDESKPLDGMGQTRLCAAAGLDPIEPAAGIHPCGGGIVLSGLLMTHGWAANSCPVDEGRHRLACAADSRHQPDTGGRYAAGAGTDHGAFPKSRMCSPKSALPKSPPTRCRPMSPTILSC